MFPFQGLKAHGEEIYGTKNSKTIPLSIKGRKHHTEFELITNKVVDKSETHSRARQDFVTFLKDYVFCLQNKKKLRAKQVISI